MSRLIYNTSRRQSRPRILMDEICCTPCEYDEVFSPQHVETKLKYDRKFNICSSALYPGNINYRNV